MITETLREERLQKSVTAYTGDVPATRAWREVGKALELTAEQLDEIGGPAMPPGKTNSRRSKSVKPPADENQLRQEARLMLEKWIGMSGQNASVEQLINVVSGLNLSDVAGKYPVRHD